MSEVEFQMVKIQTHVLKVHIHCEGCARKVKKVLNKIEGVYGVNIDAEKQKVVVCGNVDSATLIRKLKKSRKHAELWSPIQPGNQNLQALNWILDGKYHNPKEDLINGHGPSNNQTIMNPGIGRQEGYLNETAEIESLMAAHNNNFMASPLENKEHLAWVGSIATSPPSLSNSNLRSMIAFQELANKAGGFDGFKGTEFPGLQNLHAGFPSYPPVMMMNNTLEHRSLYPSPVMMNSAIPEFHAIPNMMVHGNGYTSQQSQMLMDATSDGFSPITYQL